MKSSVKDIMQRTLGPRDLVMIREQEPLFILSKGATPELSIAHQKSFYNLCTNNLLTLNYCESLPALSTVYCPVLGKAG